MEETVIISNIKNMGASIQITIDQNMPILVDVIDKDRKFHRTEGKTLYGALDKMEDILLELE